MFAGNALAAAAALSLKLAWGDGRRGREYRWTRTKPMFPTQRGVYPWPPRISPQKVRADWKNQCKVEPTPVELGEELAGLERLPGGSMLAFGGGSTEVMLGGWETGAGRCSDRDTLDMAKQ